MTVDVHGKKVMDELAKGASGYGTPGATKDKKKSFGGAIGEASGALMKGEGIGSIFSTLTAAITPLTAVLGVGVGILLMALANSKILSTFMGTIGKLFGFLVDIILLPLMPFFMMLVRYLFQMILGFRAFTKNLSLKSLLDFGVNLLLLVTPLAWIIKLIQWALGDGKLTTAMGFVANIIQGLGDWIWGLIKWAIVGVAKLPNSIIDLAVNIGSMIVGILGGLADLALSLLKYIFGYSDQTHRSLNLEFVANLVGSAWGVLQSIAGAGMSVINAGLSGLGLPTLDSGGEVMRTGVAVVHQGERYSGVTGSGQPASGTGAGNTYQFFNYGQTKTELELFNRFMDLMRQKGRGLTL